MRLRRHMKHVGGEGSHGIDLAPMLDFVLNLLIFFIITAVFVKELGLALNRASRSASPRTARSTSTTASWICAPCGPTWSGSTR
jgi:biopolymer transport protein ExbD